MAEEEQQEEQPRRRRRRLGRGARASEDASASEAATQGASETDASSDVEPDAEDVEAEEAAADVVLEADAEAEGESELPADDSEDEGDEGTEPGAAEAAEEEPEDEAAEEEPVVERPRPARAPSRRRRGRDRDPDLPPPVVRAQAKYVRSSARKARLVCDHIRGKTVEEARAILAHTPRAIARDWSKLLESAVANAEHNHELVGEDLYVKAVHADEGPTIKRFRPRAMGRATRIRKRTSHLTILLTPKE
jgi:ribosomal protein L22